MKKVRLLMLFVLAFAMLLLCACGGGGGTTDNGTHTQCADANGDGKCDVCNKDMTPDVPPAPPCTECKDNNGDGKCDVCGKNMPADEPCTECKDNDGDGKCDACGEAVEPEAKEDVIFLKDGETEFSFVISSEFTSSSIKEVDKLIKELKGYGVTVTKKDDSADTASEYEVLFGCVTTRGEEYAFDVHTLGMEGYTVQIIGNKILVAGGSDVGLVEAINVFRKDILGIDDDTRKLTDITVNASQSVTEIQDNYRITALLVNGENMKGYTIAVNKKNSTLNRAAKTIQQTIYEYSGYWLPIVDISEADRSIIVETVERTGKEGFYVNITDGCIRITTEFENRIEEEGPAYISKYLKLGKGEVNFTADDNFTKNVRDIYYSDFGATGDGVTDDYEAIRKTHQYANEWGHTVLADRDATYYIGNGHTKAAVIKTDTNWGDAKFIIDDSQIDASNAAERGMNIFNVAPTRTGGAKYTAEKGNLPIKELYSNAKNIGFAPGFTAIVKVTHASHRNYIRQGGNADDGGLQVECVLVDAEGNILPGTEPMWDYDAISAIDVTRADDLPITIQGGHFTTIYNQAPSKYTSYARGIWVYRSNVTVTNVKHLITGEGDHGAPMGGFTIASYANNVTFDNIQYDNPKSFYTEGSGGGTVVMGSYEIAANYCTNITWQNCTQVDFWLDESKTQAKSGGLMGTNHCKNMNFINMVVSSFDSHGGAQNIRIIGGQIEHINAIGAGELYMEDTIVHAMYQSCAIILRTDYGSLWKGNATFKNVTLKTGDKESVALFRAGWVNHYYGYEAQMPTNVYVENIYIDSNIGLSTLKLVMDAAESKAYLYYWDETVPQSYKDPETGETTLGPSKNVYKITEKWYIKDKYGYNYVKPEQFTTELIYQD